MNKFIIFSPQFVNATSAFKKGGINNKLYVSGSFGMWGVVASNKNMTGQMLGKVGISFYPIGNNVVIIITDSKSKNSFDPVKKFGSVLSGNPDTFNIERINGKGPAKSTTHQTYIFHLPKSHFED